MGQPSQCCRQAGRRPLQTLRLIDHHTVPLDGAQGGQRVGKALLRARPATNAQDIPKG